MVLVAGVDSSTQACKVVVRDAETGALVREGRASHPDGTEVAPEHWWSALRSACEGAGGLADVDAVAVGGQQHGMVCLDGSGAVVRDALLWNDTRSAGAAADLVAELGDGDVEAGAAAWAAAVGSVPVASFTVTKLRWLADAEPEAARRVAGVALPHDWLTWRMSGAASLGDLVTDRSDASGTGYWSPLSGTYREDLLTLALGRTVAVPRVAGPDELVAKAIGGALPGLRSGTALAAGAGDNAAAALGLALGLGEVCVSVGTSGVVSAVSATPTADPSGLVSGFADATGHFLPLCCTLNASRVLDAACALLGVGHEELSRMALVAPVGAEGLTLIPYLDGERTPNRPDATGALHGVQRANLTPTNVARAAVEGMLCGLADGLDELRRHGVAVARVSLVGGGARSEAVRSLAPMFLGCDVDTPEPGELVADGAARQAAWALSGAAEPPRWQQVATETTTATSEQRDGAAAVRERFAGLRDHVEQVRR